MVERFHKKIVYLEIVLSTDYIFVCIHIHAQTPVCIFKYIHILAAFCLLKYVRMHCASVVSDFIFLGSKITADGDCPHEIKRHLLLGRKAMTNIDRDITLPTKVRIVKAMVFPVVMYKCESWTIKKH